MNKSLTEKRQNEPASSPFGELAPRWMFDDLFGQFFGDSRAISPKVMKTAMDVAETDHAYEVTVDLPGVNPDEVEIHVEKNTLTVRGERKEEKEERDEAKHYHRVERYSGSFARSIMLPTAVDDSGAVAEFTDGVLKITIPKQENAKPRKIEVKRAR